MSDQPSAQQLDLFEPAAPQPASRQAKPFVTPRPPPQNPTPKPLKIDTTPQQPQAEAAPLPDYILRRTRRKTIGLTLRDAQLHVHAPTWVTRRQIEDAIREKTAWITEKTTLQQAHLRLLALQKNPWHPAGEIPYLGVKIRLALGRCDKTQFQGDPKRPQAGQCLILPLPDLADHARIQDLAQAWLQIQAGSFFKSRLQHYLDLAGQAITAWGLSGAQSRWGSCSAQRRIRLNWRLIHLPPNLIDYVIAHEVAHLKEMNHSPAFWQEVARLYPDYKQARDTLKQHHPATLPLF